MGVGGYIMISLTSPRPSLGWLEWLWYLGISLHMVFYPRHHHSEKQKFLPLCSNYPGSLQWSIWWLVGGSYLWKESAVRKECSVTQKSVRTRCYPPATSCLSHIPSDDQELQGVNDVTSLLLSKSQASFHLANSNLETFQDRVSGKHRSLLTQVETIQTTIFLFKKHFIFPCLTSLTYKIAVLIL